MSAGGKEVSRAYHAQFAFLFSSHPQRRELPCREGRGDDNLAQVVTKCITRGMTADILANTGFFSSHSLVGIEDKVWDTGGRGVERHRAANRCQPDGRTFLVGGC